jgi:hypothetical protein
VRRSSPRSGKARSVTGTAARAGHHRQRFYELREADEELAGAWAEALEHGTDLLEDELRRRGLEGSDEETFDRDGALVRRLRPISPPDLITALKARRPNVYRDNGSTATKTAAVSARRGLDKRDRDRVVYAARFESMLASRGPSPPTRLSLRERLGQTRLPPLRHPRPRPRLAARHPRLLAHVPPTTRAPTWPRTRPRTPDVDVGESSQEFRERGNDRLERGGTTKFCRCVADMIALMPLLAAATGRLVPSGKTPARSQGRHDVSALRPWTAGSSA